MKKTRIGGIVAVVAVIGLALIGLLAACNNGNNGTGTGGKPETGDGSHLILESGSKPETLASYEGRTNVIKIDGTDTTWAVVKYPLNKYKGKQITIEFQADVRREGAAGDLLWVVNNNGIWPEAGSQKNAAEGVWHRMRGRLIVTPANSDPCLYLSNYNLSEDNSRNTVYYIANFTVTITEGNPLTPDLTLTPLKSVYANDFLIGSIIDIYSTYSFGKYFDLLTHHNSVVTSTVTYPNKLAPSVKGGAYQWAEADRVINLVTGKGIPVHGHVLVWHELTPEWMTTGARAEVEQNLTDHINTVLGHFKGRVTGWDVVNEGMADGLSSAQAAGDWKDCVRRSIPGWPNPWYDTLGPDYIERAFRAARAADPSITLYYNDHSLDNQNKAEAVRKMIADINTRYRAEGNTRSLIEGVGMQGHYKSYTNVDDVRKSLDKFKTLGIEIAITELDITDNWEQQGSGRDTPMSERDELAQARVYAKLFRLFKAYSADITRVTFWGLDDGTSWLSVGNPCLFDWKLRAKKAYYAVIDPDGFLKQYGE